MVCWARRPRARERRRKLWKGGHPPYPPRARGSAPPASQAAPNEYRMPEARLAAARAVRLHVVLTPQRPLHTCRRVHPRQTPPQPDPPSPQDQGFAQSLRRPPATAMPLRDSFRPNSHAHGPPFTERNRASVATRTPLRFPPATRSTNPLILPHLRACWRNQVGAVGVRLRRTHHNVRLLA